MKAPANPSRIPPRAEIFTCLLAVALFCAPSLGAAQEQEPSFPAVSPIDVGPNRVVGSGARAAEQMKSAAIGLIGGLLGARSRSEGADGPVLADCRVRDRDMTVFKDASSAVAIKAAAKRVKDNVVVFVDIVTSPDQGTFETSFLRNLEGQRLAPARADMCALWGEWSLSVAWSSAAYLNGQRTAGQEGGWFAGERFSGIEASAEGAAGLWRRFGFSNASHGARRIALTYKVSGADLQREPLNLVVHVTRPGQDPVVTAPFSLIMRETPEGGVTLEPAPAPKPPDEQRLVADEVVFEVKDGTGAEAIAALALRNELLGLETTRLDLTGATLVRARILDRRPVGVVLTALALDPLVLSAQPNYLFALEDKDASASRAAPLQYAPTKLRLPEAHRLAKGDHVLVGMIDSGVDPSHPELAGAIAGTFDAVGGAGGPQAHGTAIASLIAAHDKLLGSAPDSRILAARAFDGAGAKGSTFNILKGLDWAVAKGARIINLSFAGPADPALGRGLDAAYRRGVILVAAAGNDGPKAPPVYPGADPHVIAVGGTDAEDRPYANGNRGAYIAVAAPGVDVLTAAPDGGYQVQTGTSFSAAEVTGVIALMRERKPALSPDAVRATLVATGMVVGGQTPPLVNAYQALSANR